MAGLVDRVDNAQRRWPSLGLPIATLYKFVDDQGSYLAAIITYYAFVAIFPLLLLATSVLGFFLQGDPELRRWALDSTLSQFPIVGDQLGRPEGLQGSVSAVVVGGVAALYGSLGLGSAIQNALAVAWSVPRNSRPNPFLLRLKSLFLLLAAGGAVLAVTALSVVGRRTDVLAEHVGLGLSWLVSLLTVLVLAGMLGALLRLAAAKRHPWRHALPGGLFIAVLWQGLQVLSTTYVDRVLSETSSMNQTFGLVLGIVGLIFVASVIAVLGIELNVVIARRLWPRALLTPFTDAVDLTSADKRAYTSYARAQRHKGFEEVSVTFADRDEEEPEPGDVEPGAAVRPSGEGAGQARTRTPDATEGAPGAAPDQTGGRPERGVPSR